MFIKKKPDDLIKEVTHMRNYLDVVMDKYLKEYADYGQDDLSNDLMSASLLMESVRLKLQHAAVLEDF